MKVLELFAGSRSIGNAAESLGMKVFSVDINDFDNIDLVKDIEFLVPGDIPFIPDVIWASPPCTTYSLAAISHHRPLNGLHSEFADKSDRLVINTLKIIKHFDCTFYIENPIGMLSKQKFMAGIPRVSVTYCTYGDLSRMKPTHIWSNNIYSLFNPDGWYPREKCFNDNPHCNHERAPRGSATGTQGLKGAYERSKIPKQLCDEILKACIK